MRPLVLDTGALIALQREPRWLRALTRIAHEEGRQLRTSAPVLTEFLGGSPRDLRAAAQYVCSGVHADPVDAARARHAAKLRQTAMDHAPASSPSTIDALVAAEAEAAAGILVHRGDSSDFEALAGAAEALQLIDLTDLV